MLYIECSTDLSLINAYDYLERPRCQQHLSGQPLLTQRSLLVNDSKWDRNGFDPLCFSVTIRLPLQYLGSLCQFIPMWQSFIKIHHRIQLIKKYYFKPIITTFLARHFGFKQVQVTKSKFSKFIQAVRLQDNKKLFLCIKPMSSHLLNNKLNFLPKRLCTVSVSVNQNV